MHALLQWSEFLRWISGMYRESMQWTTLWALNASCKSCNPVYATSTKHIHRHWLISRTHDMPLHQVENSCHCILGCWKPLTGSPYQKLQWPPAQCPLPSLAIISVQHRFMFHSRHLSCNVALKPWKPQTSGPNMALWFLQKSPGCGKKKASAKQSAISCWP